MTKKGHFKDARLLKALDYIDQDLVGEVAVKLRFDDASSLTEEPVITWRTPFKHWKSLATLAACILLLSIASPLVGYIAQVIADWGAAAGVGTTEEMSESESKELHELFPDYTPAPLSEKRVEELSKVLPVLSSDDEWTQYVWRVQNYLGDFNGCFCFYSDGHLQYEETKIIAGYEFTRSTSFTLEVVYNGEIMYMNEAYDKGYLTRDEIGMMAAYHARLRRGIVILEQPETTTPLYNLFPDYVPEPLDEEKKKEIEVLLGGDKNWYYETQHYLDMWYLGTFNEHVIFLYFDEFKDLQDRVVIAGYPFALAKDAKLVAYVEGELLDLEYAYGKGLFTDEEIGMVASLNHKLIWQFNYPEDYFK